MQKEKSIILFTVLVDVIGFGIVIPILPFYVSSFGVSEFTITLLFAAYSFFSFLSNPFLGSLSDKFGRRPILLTCIVSTAIGWYVFASAASLVFLFLGRIIDGIAAGNFSTAQSYIADLSKSEKDRTANMGLLGAIFGIGFILGPLLGGLLSKVSHAFPFWFAGILATINCITAFFFLPETHHHRNTETKIHYNPFRPLQKALRDKIARPYYITQFLFSSAFVVTQSIFALFVSVEFGLDAAMTGILFTFIGIVVAINQLFLLKKVWLMRFSETQLEIIMLAVMGIAFLFLATKNVWMSIFSIPLFGIAQSTLRAVITSQVVGTATQQTKGEKMGILASILSFAMFFSPIIAGKVFEFDHRIPFILASVLTWIAFFVSYKRSQKTEISGQKSEVSN